MGRRGTSEGMKLLYDEFIAGDAERVARHEAKVADLIVGVEINRLRRRAGLSMKALAERLGTQPSAIARLERTGEGRAWGRAEPGTATIEIASTVAVAVRPARYASAARIAYAACEAVRRCGR